MSSLRRRARGLRRATHRRPSRSPHSEDRVCDRSRAGCRRHHPSDRVQTFGGARLKLMEAQWSERFAVTWGVHFPAVRRSGRILPLNHGADHDAQEPAPRQRAAVRAGAAVGSRSPTELAPRADTRVPHALGSLEVACREVIRGRANGGVDRSGLAEGAAGLGQADLAVGAGGAIAP
jgi:hypothetical protein